MSICRTAVFDRCRSRSVGCAVTISEADHEARGIAEIVSKGRPQLVMNSNRIARATKLGAALSHARLRTCDSASSACKTLQRERGEAPARNSQIITQMGVGRATFDGRSESSACPSSNRPVGLPCEDYGPFAEDWV